MNTHLDGHVEDFGDVDHHMHVACDCIVAQERLQDWEEVLDQLVQGLALRPKFQFKCLEETLKRAKG